MRLIRSPPAPARAARRRPGSSRPRAAGRRAGRPRRARRRRDRRRGRRTRSQSSSASSTSCVTSSTVRGSAASAARSHSCSSARVIASSAPNGSSRSSTALSCEQRAQERDPLAHPAGEPRRTQPLRPLQAEPLEQRRRAPACLRRGTPAFSSASARVVERRPPGQQAIALRHQRATGKPRGRRRLAADRRSAGVRLVEPRDEREQRRLAGAAPADDPDAGHAAGTSRSTPSSTRCPPSTRTTPSSATPSPSAGLAVLDFENRVRHALPSPA